MKKKKNKLKEEDEKKNPTDKIVQLILDFFNGFDHRGSLQLMVCVCVCSKLTFKPKFHFTASIFVLNRFEHSVE